MTVTDCKRLLRARSEYVLRLAAMDDVGRRYPGCVTKSALPRDGAFWRYVFVPLYRRVPWSFKRKAMRVLRMTARNWPEDARRFGEPWRPPPNGTRASAGGSLERSRESSERPREVPSAER
jgi:hypothetical protein